MSSLSVFCAVSDNLMSVMWQFWNILTPSKSRHLSGLTLHMCHKCMGLFAHMNHTKSTSCESSLGHFCSPRINPNWCRKVLGWQDANPFSLQYLRLLVYYIWPHMDLEWHVSCKEKFFYENVYVGLILIGPPPPPDRTLAPPLWGWQVTTLKCCYSWVRLHYSTCSYH